LIKGTPRHPIVEDDVVIYAGATILGRITIGKGSVIGGNVRFTHSVPPGSNVLQAQMRHAHTLDDRAKTTGRGCVSTEDLGQSRVRQPIVP